MLGTSLHTLVQMVDNGLGLTLVPKMAVAAGILDGTGVVTRRLDAAVTSRRIVLAWRRGSARAAEFKMLGEALVEARAV
jgi:LysR family hydrogen peroxide-inducible transcriptional activator